MTSITPLFDRFVEFCGIIPSDKTIDHDTFNSCAVGDFVEHCGMCDAPISIAYNIDAELNLVSKDFEHEFVNKLGNAHLFPEIATYGGLHAYLLNLQSRVRHAAQ